MKAYFIILLAFVVYQCLAETIVVEEETWSIQSIIRKTIPSSVNASIKKSDTGYATSCGPDGTHLNLTWTPKTIIQNEALHVSLEMIAPFDFKETFTASANVSMEGGQPFLQASQNVSCNELAALVPDLKIKCPIVKGSYVKLTNIDFSAFTPRLLPGEFSARGTLESPKKELFACAKLDVEIDSGDS